MIVFAVLIVLMDLFLVGGYIAMLCGKEWLMLLFLTGEAVVGVCTILTLIAVAVL